MDLIPYLISAVLLGAMLALLAANALGSSERAGSFRQAEPVEERPAPAGEQALAEAPEERDSRDN